VIASSLQHRRSFWDLRDFVTHSQKPEGGSIKHDVSVPVASVPEFIDKASAEVVKFMPGARVVAFGHLGDGNIHFNVTQPVGADKQAFLDQWRAMNDVVHDVVASYGGSISAEHGIGVMKRDELVHVKDPVAIALMRQLKATLDPNGILNPGKVV
jgi:FAD/FMN-containing dehydrogenase